jgi:prepilin peptidase dependent protein B
MLRTARALPGRQRGLSIIEFMVGITVGLFVVGGAVKMFVDMFVGNHRHLIEARVNQDLRAAADIVARDLRRGAFWRQSLTGIGAVAPAVPASNPHAPMTVASGAVEYSYDRDGNTAIDAPESSGFRMQGGTIEMLTGSGWQALTDPRSVLVTNFSIANSADSQQWGDLWQYCDCLARMTCTTASFQPAGANFANRPQVGLRLFDVVIEGRSVADARVTRRLVESVRMRNDTLRGACPA